MEILLEDIQVMKKLVTEEIENIFVNYMSSNIINIFSIVKKSGFLSGSTSEVISSCFNNFNFFNIFIILSFWNWLTFNFNFINTFHFVIMLFHQLIPFFSRNGPILGLLYYRHHYLYDIKWIQSWFVVIWLFII